MKLRTAKVFPAYAGVIPCVYVLIRGLPCFPRIRGGDPGVRRYARFVVGAKRLIRDKKDAIAETIAYSITSCIRAICATAMQSTILLHIDFCLLP